ncbi:RNA polymerase-associated protein CTR9 like protein [Babesia gibsoni]|uniref:RNA polymerase-associated protein CTR9 like protein n=1 Tax=Babesia gibsoni TaxID=33632 RepID=A0AAD8PEY5_BABGI|nr:RNA polymerase-associated protein CTR9 like protein [Babesia gibsoni]
MNIGLDSGFVLPLKRQQSLSVSEGAGNCLWLSQEKIIAPNIDRLRSTLKAESASLKYWILLAFSYRNGGDLEIFESLLKEAEARLDATSKGTEHYTWNVAMGHCHLSNIIHHHQSDEGAKAKECFQSAISSRPYSISAVIYYANMLILENNYANASVYYTRALVLCNYLETLLTICREFGNPPKNEMQCEYYQLDIQLKHIKALVIFALACCKYFTFDMDDAHTLLEASLRVKRTPQALRLRGAMAAIHLLEKHEETDVEGSHESSQSSPHVSFENMVNEWSEATCEAYLLDPSSGIGRIHLSEFLFQRGMIDECENKLSGIKRNSLPPQLHADLTYQLAKCAHAKGDMSKAFSLYGNVLNRKTDFITARVQLIKAAIGSGNLAAAREQCELLSKHNYKSFEFLRLNGLTYLFSACETMDDSREKLLKAEPIAPDIDITSTLNNIQTDVGRLVEERLYKALGALEEAKALEPEDKLSQQYYISCVELLISRGRDNLVPKLREAYIQYNKLWDTGNSVEFRNNDAVLALRSRKWNESLSKLSRLWEEIESSPEVPEPTKITVQFNLALVHDEMGNMSKAHNLYSHLTREYPRYVSAWLRKSNLAFRRGDIDTAHRYLEQLKANHRKSADAWLYKAYQFFALGRFDECIEELRKLFRTINSATFDPYANTLFACALIRRSNRGGFGKLPKEVLNFARAGLRRHSLGNFYAANCIAIYLAHEGNLKASQESFGILLENQGNNTHMKYIANRNMGLLCAAMALGNEKQTEKGIYDRLRASKAHQHLQNALVHGKLNSDLHLIYSRFLYDCQRFEECSRFLESSRLVFPHDPTYLYNLVVVVDSTIWRHMRNSEKLSSATEVSKMLVQARFILSAAKSLMGICSEYPKMSSTHLQQICTRVKEKLIPHLNATLPQLEAASADKQKSRGKHIELQMSIQQANEARQLELERERRRAEEAERLLSEQLLKEASDIASEIAMSRPLPGSAEPPENN